MQIFYKVDEIQGYLTNFNTESTGFVATMGALHEGHLGLISLSKAQNKLTICSIFVNPKQFNKEEDLIKYPRNIEADLRKLENAGCDVVFIPSVEEMYPVHVETTFDFGHLSNLMEGRYRPGHFNGVAIVIERFFEILNPTNAYFGEKDFQQLAVIKELVRQLNSPVNIVGCPIYREENGLAMSSRNERLSESEKEIATKISSSLNYVAQHKKDHSIIKLKEHFLNQISSENAFDLEYFEIVDKETLKPISSWDEAKNYIAFTAVNIAGVRLIDNMTIIN